MFSVIESARNLPVSQPSRSEGVALNLSEEPLAPEEAVRKLASIEGPLDVYYWFEGPSSLPLSGALCMQQIFQQLYALKPDIRLGLYSLRAWNFKASVSKMSDSTPLGNAINRLNNLAVQAIFSSDFFRYCADISDKSSIYSFLQEELPRKTRLTGLSEGYKEKNFQIKDLFEESVSLFDCFKEWDVAHAYAQMQYVEGYYLIRQSILKGLDEGKERIQIAFLLPNDEWKYYQDLSQDIQKMMELDFGERLAGVQIGITFQYFLFGSSLDSRPYIGRGSGVKNVGAKNVCSYFDFLTKQQVNKKNS